VEDLAGVGALVAARRLDGLDRRQPVEAQASESAADGGGRNADLGGDLLARGGVAAKPRSRRPRRAPFGWARKADTTTGRVNPFGAEAFDPLASVFGMMLNRPATADPPALLIRCELIAWLLTGSADRQRMD